MNRDYGDVFRTPLKGNYMENQKGKRGASDGQETTNLSELLEFDFDSVNNVGAADQNKQEAKPSAGKQQEQSMDSFFSDAEKQTQKKTTGSGTNKKAGKDGTAKAPKDPHDKALAKRSVWSIVKGVFVWSKEIIVALLLVWLLLTFVAQNSTVYGSSMEPTLYSGEMIIVNKFIYRFTEPLRGDIIVFEHEDAVKGKELMIKRIIGMPGDTVELIDGDVYINGEKYDESGYLVEKTEITGNITEPFVVPENSYFVMGDHRSVSKDSRYSDVGAISKDQIIGKASFRFWPLDKLSIIQ